MEKSNALQITHVIFDLDGVLIDTAHLYRKAMNAVVVGLKKDCPQDILLEMTMKSIDDGIKFVQTKLKLDVPFEVLKKKYVAESNKIISDNKLMPGVEKLVRHLTLFKVPMALCTSTDEKIFNLKGKKHPEFFKLFNPIVFGNECPPKPSPDVYLLCLKKFHDQPCAMNCLVFEDTVHGLVAAHAAGMHVVLVSRTNYKKDDTKFAAIVAQTVEGLELRQFGLPPLAPE